jgi:hypothetical protein
MGCDVSSTSVSFPFIARPELTTLPVGPQQSDVMPTRRMARTLRTPLVQSTLLLHSHRAIWLIICTESTSSRHPQARQQPLRLFPRRTSWLWHSHRSPHGYSALKDPSNPILTFTRTSEHGPFQVGKTQEDGIKRRKTTG